MTTAMPSGATDILTDLSPAALASAHKANLHSFLRRAEASPAMEYARFDAFERWRSSHPSAMLNGALAVRNAREDDAHDVDATLEYFRAAGTQAVTWWLEEGVEPEGWRRLLTERGFMLVSGSPGMSLDLDTLPADVAPPPGAEIRRAMHIDNLRPFARIITRVFGFHLESEKAAFEWASGLGVDWPTLSYIAYFNGRPAGTSMVHFGGGVAGIYYVAVEPEARCHGLGAALTLVPLLEARELGYRAAVLQSPDMAVRVYARLGFREHCRVDHFILGLSSSCEPPSSPICDAQARLAASATGETEAACEE